MNLVHLFRNSIIAFVVIFPNHTSALDMTSIEITSLVMNCASKQSNGVTGQSLDDCSCVVDMVRKYGYSYKDITSLLEHQRKMDDIDVEMMNAIAYFCDRKDHSNDITILQ